MASNYRDLNAYRLAAALADEVYRRVRAWNEFDQRTMGEQLMRAVDSVGSNIAESSGRWTTADRRNFLVIARGSLHETEHWLDRARARDLINDDLPEKIPEIARCLNGLLKRSHG
jgi:four helix bundle protein